MTRLYKILFLVFVFNFTSMYSGAVEIVSLPISEGTLSCKPAALTLVATEIASLVSGKYPDFKFEAARFEHACFYRHYLIDYASKYAGHLDANVEISKRNVEEPIYTCKKPPCSFCDPDCEITGYKHYTEESVYIDVIGIRFFGRSRLD